MSRPSKYASSRPHVRRAWAVRGLETLESRRVPATFIVNSTGDAPDLNPGDGVCLTSLGAGICTLRAAIQEANLTPGRDRIEFRIGGGLRSIQPGSPLPAITDPVVLDAVPPRDGAGNVIPAFSNQVIQIRGLNAGDAADGLTVIGGGDGPGLGSIIRGFVINEFDGSGIALEGDPANPARGYNTLEGNFIGVNSLGSVVAANGASGVVIRNSLGNLVGAPSDATPALLPGRGNLISGSGANEPGSANVEIVGGSTGGNVVMGNHLGTDRLGRVALRAALGVFGVKVDGGVGDAITRNLISGNSDDGVAARGSTDLTISSNTIGAAKNRSDARQNRGDGISVIDALHTVIMSNQISANGGVLTGHGVFVAGSGSIRTEIRRNTIGLDGTGARPLGNTGHGVFVFESLVAAATDADRTAITDNVISANGGAGVAALRSSGLRISKNLIGTDAKGEAVRLASGRSLGNGSHGVSLESSFDARVGGTAGRGNVISGNRGDGVAILGAESVNVILNGNIVGLNKSHAVAAKALGNAGWGVRIVDGSENRIGSTRTDSNVISANRFGGILIAGGKATSNEILGNDVGTNSKGASGVGNQGDGVVIDGASWTKIGHGVDPASKFNVIAGNTGTGVVIRGATATKNALVGNFIGTRPKGGSIGNGGSGVVIENSGGNRVGQRAGKEYANTIVGNGGAGIRVMGALSGNKLVRNVFQGNAGLGIDLVGGAESPAGVTANDAGDADLGANELMNCPELISATTASGVTIRGILRSRPNSRFMLEFQESPTCDPSGFGEGSRFLGDFEVQTDANGEATFAISFPTKAVAGRFVTALSTGLDGGEESTSEFSNCAVVRAAT